ncbi:methyl-accepting chemotaxis protein [Methylomonas koyamae]|uniref:methyl-accepting chemotaxis protein n=1 Tax=Methylomonas koyamae TaxID=702114 RepID=UPI0028C434CF|nr:methyl-accepting chemotaxis protein [Methylomonas koyamae]
MKINHPVTDREVLMKEGTILVTKTDLKGRIVDVNEAFVEISGFSREELLGQNHNIVRHPDMPPEAFADLWSTISKGKPWRNLVKNRCKSGDYYWVEANVSPVFEQGKVTGYVSARYAPSREQIRAAELLYDRVRNKKSQIRSDRFVDKINFVNRLNITAKLVLFALLLLLPGAVLLGMVNQDKNADIEFARKEIRGVDYLKSLKHLLVELTEHRGASYLALSAAGNRDSAALSQSGKRVADAIKAADAVDAEFGAEFNSTEAWQKIKSDWALLEPQNAAQLTAQASLAKHSELVENVTKLMIHVSDQSNLTLDPEVGTYYVMNVVSIRLPELIDHVSEHMANAVVFAKAGTSLDPQAKIEMAVVDQHIGERLGETEHDLAVAYAADAEAKTALADKQEIMFGDTAKFSDLIEQNLYLASAVNVSPDRIAASGASALQAVNALYDAASPLLRSMLQKRVDGLEQEKYRQFAAVSGLIVIVALIGFAIVRHITSNLRTVKGVFAKITEGNFRSTIHLDGHDELGDLLRSLQMMQVNLNVDISDTRERAIKATRVERALDNVSSCVMLANSNLEIIYMNRAVAELFKNAEQDIRQQLPRFDSAKLMGANIDQFHKNPSHQRGMLAKLESTYKSGLEIGSRHMNIIANPVIDAEGNRIGTVVEWLDRTHEVKIEREIADIVEAVKVGELSSRIELGNKQGFFASLSAGINELTDVIENVFSDIGSTMQSMAEGDLTNRIDRDYRGTYLKCKNDINSTIDKLNEIFGQVSESAHFINNSSQEIASGNNNLSHRAEQQAANLEQTAASMEQLTSTVKNNADNAQQANLVANNAKDLAEKGGNVVKAAVSAMQEINESSNKIADIIGVIDEIAFQTNLLALNASVEAARAGEQGRGFSVVATEVRNLAQRSATAARESKELIQNSVQKVRAGTEFVNETGKALTEIVAGVKKVGDIVAQIADASVEQSAGIGQVNQAVAQMDEITQQNAALAEEASAASVSMSDLSTNMVEMLAFFKTDKNIGQQPVAQRGHSPTVARAEVVRSAPVAAPAANTQPAFASKSNDADDEWQDF